MQRKRMLVIANPYATTVSDRLKSLVVYALQGRYDVDTVDTEGRDHATELCREAAAEGYDVVVAFGGDGTVNEAANGLAGTAHARWPRSRRRDERLLPACSASRTTSSTPPSTCSASPTPGRRGGSTSASSTAAVHVLRRHTASTPRSSAASTPTRSSRRACATGTSPTPRSRRSPGSTSSTRRGSTSRSPAETVRGVTALVQVGDPYTYCSGRPLARRRGHRARRRHDRRRRAAARQRRPTCRRSWPGCSRTACAVAGHRRVFACERPDRRALRVGRRPPDPAAGRRRLRRRHGRGASSTSSRAR